MLARHGGQRGEESSDCVVPGAVGGFETIGSDIQSSWVMIQPTALGKNSPSSFAGAEAEIKVTPSRIYDVWFPDAEREYNALVERGGSLVHYTSAEVAVSAIRSGELWFTNVLGMNDTSEAKQAIGVLQSCYSRSSGRALAQALANVTGGLGGNILEVVLADFGQIWSDHGYVACLSEQQPGEADVGRLSMWRAYGGNAAVAVVVRARELPRLACSRQVAIAPVRYTTAAGIDAEILTLANRISASERATRGMTREHILEAVPAWAYNTVVLSKNDAFREEREYRLYPKPQHINLFKHAVESVRGIPQIVLKLPFATPRPGQLRRELVSSLFEKFIVGPSQYQRQITYALRETLREAGVKEPNQLIAETSIPFRTRT